jgi:hypothetical protein
MDPWNTRLGIMSSLDERGCYDGLTIQGIGAEGEKTICACHMYTAPF